MNVNLYVGFCRINWHMYLVFVYLQVTCTVFSMQGFCSTVCLLHHWQFSNTWPLPWKDSSSYVEKKITDKKADKRWLWDWPMDWYVDCYADHPHPRITDGQKKDIFSLAIRKRCTLFMLLEGMWTYMYICSVKYVFPWISY